MLLCANGGLRAVGMARIQLGVQRIVCLAEVVGKRNILLLIHRLELCVESPYHHILKPVGLYAQPVLHLVCRYVFGVTGHVVAGISVGALRSYRRHELVVFVGYEETRRQLRQTVYLAVAALALLRVGERAVVLVLSLDGVEQWLLCRIVGGSESLCPLKHQVLQIVSQPGGLGRVVAASGAHGDVGLYARLLVVDREVNRQAVVKFVYPRLHHVAVHRLILIVFAMDCHRHGQCHAGDKERT